jgi:hypothetical protein
MAKNKSNLRFFITLSLVFVVLGCNSIQSFCDSTSLKPIPIQLYSETVTVLSEGENVRERILGDQDSAFAWNQKQNMFPVGGQWGTWLTQFTLSNDYKPQKTGGLVRLSSQQPSYGRLLISNVFQTPHSLGLMFLLDYQPLYVRIDSDVRVAYYLPEMPVGAEQAIEFLFPPFPKGLHHLSIVLITDPESESTDPDYRWSQQQSFSEQRFDLWVDIEAIPANTPAFVNQEQAIAAGGFRSQFEIVEIDSSPYKLVEELQFEVGTNNKLGLLFAVEEQSSNSPPYTGTLPLRIGVFWNDTLHTAFDYELDPKLKLSEPFLLPFTIETPTEPGAYQMQIIAFATPWHPHFNADGEWIVFNHASFSRRIPVDVVEKR